MNNHQDSNPFPSSTATHWASGAVAVGLGVGLVLLWKVWGRCRRRVHLSRMVDASPALLYRFLCQPHSLEVIHPFVTEIRLKSEREEADGATVKDFDLVEKVPMTVVTAARMRCDPTTSTITIDFVPVGGLVSEVQLTWEIKPGSSLSPGQETQQTDSPRERRPSAGVITPRDPADDKPMTTSGGSADVDGQTSTDAKTGRTEGCSPDSESSSEFHNYIQVTGPSVLLVYVFLKILESIHNKVMNRLQGYFKNASNQDAVPIH